MSQGRKGLKVEVTGRPRRQDDAESAGRKQQGDGDVQAAGGVGWIWGGWEWVWFGGEGLAQNLTAQQRARGMTANSACAAVAVVVVVVVVVAATCQRVPVPPRVFKATRHLSCLLEDDGTLCRGGQGHSFTSTIVLRQ